MQQPSVWRGERGFCSSDWRRGPAHAPGGMVVTEGRAMAELQIGHCSCQSCRATGRVHSMQRAGGPRRA